MLFSVRLGRPKVPYGVIRAIRNVGLAILIGTGVSAAEQVTVAALGDSLTQGYGLPPADGFVPQLERWLAENGAEVSVINAGVSGDTTAGGLSRIEWTLTPEVDALIITLGGNDILRGIDPTVAKANLAGILDVATEHSLPVLLVGMDAPSNYGVEYEAAFDAMYSDLAQSYDTLFHDDFLAPLTSQKDRQAALGELMQADGIHPNAAGVALIVEALGPRVLELIGATGE